MITYSEIAALVENVQFEIPRTSKHVAVLLHGSKIEGVFVNKFAVHAEELAVAAFVANNRRIRKPRIYVTRLSKTNTFSRPCKHCCMLLAKFPQIRVFYTNTNGEWVEEQTFDAFHISHRRKQCGFFRR